MKKLLLLLLIIFYSCDDGKPKFSEIENKQAHYFIEALNYDNESIKISNSGTAYSKIPSEEINKMLVLKKQALELAKKIPENVLVKMHKELPENYEVYKRGLKLRIKNLEEGDIQSEVEGSKLLEKWGEWFQQNKSEIKIPKA